MDRCAVFYKPGGRFCISPAAHLSPGRLAFGTVAALWATGTWSSTCDLDLSDASGKPTPDWFNNKTSPDLIKWVMVKLPQAENDYHVPRRFFLDTPQLPPASQVQPHKKELQTVHGKMESKVSLSWCKKCLEIHAPCFHNALFSMNFPQCFGTRGLWKVHEKCTWSHSIFLWTFGCLLLQQHHSFPRSSSSQ